MTTNGLVVAVRSVDGSDLPVGFCCVGARNSVHSVHLRCSLQRGANSANVADTDSKSARIEGSDFFR